MFKIAKQIGKVRKDIVGSKDARDENGTLRVKDGKVEKLFLWLLRQ